MKIKKLLHLPKTQKHNPYYEKALDKFNKRIQYRLNGTDSPKYYSSVDKILFMC